MKKSYITPQMESLAAEMESMIAKSLQVDNTAQDRISGDVKGDWGDIWSDSDASFEE